MSDVATAVVGGGIGGLAAAVEATQFGDVVLFEADERVGGELHSAVHDGYLCEHAAASIPLPAAGMSTLIATVGASADLVQASATARNRWIHYGDGLHAVPASPPALLKSSIVSPWAKLGALLDVAVPPATAQGEESVHDFVARRLGAEVAGRLAQPIVAGVFVGDATRISVDAAFPNLRDLEAGGGLLRGGLRRMRTGRKAGAPRASLHSFADGMEQLAHRCAKWLGDTVRRSSIVESAEPTDDGWRLEVAGTGTVTARRLVLTCPPEVSARLLGPLAGDDLGTILAATVRAPVAVVHLGVPAETLVGFEGFGFLAHPRGGLPILGAVFDSAVFAGRAPEGRHLVRVLLGGSLSPETVDAEDGTLVTYAAGALSRALGRRFEADFVNVVRHHTGIPQYEIGHRGRVQAIDAQLDTLGGIAVAGWGYRSVGVNGVVADATSVVRNLHGSARSA